MGTRSVTIVYDDETPLIAMYRQMDGYPSCHGAELGQFLKYIEIVNGLGSNPNKVANGAGCLAAQMIAYFKEGPGGIYIEPIDADRKYIDYIYKIKVNGFDVTVDIEDEFIGNVSEFINYCNRDE